MIITEWFFYINNFSLIVFYHSVGLWTIRLSAGAGAHIEYRSRSRAEDMTITYVIIKNSREEIRLGCEWRHARKWWSEVLGDFEKDVSWDFTLAEASQAGGLRDARLLGELVEIWLWARQFNWGVDCGRCRNSKHSKKLCVCLSLSPRVERLKVKKWINVSYLNNESRQCFGISLHLNILYIIILVLCYTILVITIHLIAYNRKIISN